MGNIGSSILTFLLSVPLTVVAFVAIFGVPQVAQPGATSSDDIVIRDPFQEGWASKNQFANNNGGAQLGPSSNWPPAQNTQPQNPSPSGFSQQSSGGANSNNAPTWAQQTAPQSYGNKTPQQANGGVIQTPNNPFAPKQVPQQQQGRSNDAPPFGESVAQPNQFFETQQVGFEEQRDFDSNHFRSAPQETGKQLLTWQEASNRLTDLRVSKYHLESGSTPGQFLFVCLFNHPTAPQVIHRFEAEGNDPLVAVNQVITKLDQWIAEESASQAYPNPATRF